MLYRLGRFDQKANRCASVHRFDERFGFFNGFEIREHDNVGSCGDDVFDLLLGTFMNRIAANQKLGSVDHASDVFYIFNCMRT